MLNPYMLKIYKGFLLTGAILFQLGYFAPQTHAQRQLTIIEGKVVDGYGKPLADVQVNIKGRSASVLTDKDGHFAIQAAFNDRLVFYHPDFDVKEQVVRSGHLTIRLAKCYLQNPDTINILYGKQAASNVLGAVSTIYNHQLITTPAAQYTFAMPGRLPGLYTQQLSGWPSQSSTPLIDPEVSLWVKRMAGTEGLPGPNDNSQMLLSLRGQTPITIIDGVQRDFYSIAPENIQSVSVLKDALSTILLGQQSSRGVLLITTKRPQKGAPRISFTAQTAMQNPLDLPRPLPAYQYAWLYNEGLLNDNRSPVYTAEDFQAYRDGSDPVGHPNVNWYKTVLRDNAPMSRYDLNISGGGNVARYTMGLDYMNKQGLFTESEGNPYKTNPAVNRYTVNSHVAVDVNKYFKAGLDIFGRIENTNQPGAGIPAIMSALISTPNNAYPIFNPDGSLAGNQTYANNIYGMVGSTGYMAGHNRDVMANIDLRYDLKKWLPGLWAKLMGNVSVSSSDVIDRSKGFPVFGMAITPNGDTAYNRYGNPYDQRNTYSLTSFAQYWYGQLSIGYDKQFGKNKVSAMLFADRRQATINYDLPSKYTNLALKVSYDRNSKYFAEAAVNYSGHDRFPPGARFGLFYAAGLGWDMAQENFIKDDLPWVNQLKWRVTYGQTGNANVGYFVYEQYYKDDYPSGAWFGSSYITGTIENPMLPNPYVTWEKAHKLNIGLDVSLSKDHLRLTADYYRNKYYDLMQLRGKTIALIGNNYPPENIGINRYTGGELSLTYQDHAGSINWFITANASMMKTRVLYMDEVHRDYPWNRRTGQPVGQLFGYIEDGLFQTQKEVDNSAHPEGLNPIPGDIKYKDLNNDGVINVFDQAPIGNTKPLLYYGLTAGIGFKGLDLSVLIQGVQNRSILLNGSGAWPFNAFSNGQAWESNLGRWTPQTAATATSPRLTAGFNKNNIIPFSTYWIRSGNYIRLKNVEIGYSLPYKWISRLKLGEVRFFANGLNLFTHSPNENIDPEVSSQTSGAVYPIQRVTNVGITIKF